MRHAVLFLFLVLPVTARAEATIDLVFEPPVIKSQPICAPRLSDDALIAAWKDYAGAPLPAGDTALIKRDLRRLIEMDPRRWFDIVALAQGQLRGVDPGYSDANILIDKIELLVAAGRLSDLQAQRLVPQLMTMDLSQTPRAQTLLAGYLMRGIGLPRDPAKGEAMLVSAAFGGNADAILTLVERQIAASPVAGWDVPPDLAVTMAFGALVGQLDPLICDRVNRIAREYAKGEIVTRDVALAERWFRFAADLGDAISAWRVAEMHLRSEDLAKDNAILLRYLNRAADAGLPYAQVALARIEATGALVPKDLEAAEASYKAAANDWIPGQASYVLFLQEQSRADKRWTPHYRRALAELVAGENPPAWALIAEADQILADKGRWAGEADAVALLNRAVGLGEFAATERLTAMQFRTARSPADFYVVMDRMIQVVLSSGEVDPMLSLSNAFICRSPDAPQVAEADYWTAVSDSTATVTVDFTPDQLWALAEKSDPIAEGEIQAQALSGRVSAIAQYIYLIQARGVPASELAFWDSYGNRFAGVRTARAALAVKAARTPAERSAGLQMFRGAISAGEVSAGTQFAEALLDDETTTAASQAEALTVLLPLADRGVGDAMALLPRAAPDQFPTLDTVVDRYQAVIDARGDFDALLLALPRLNDRARFDDYLVRAASVTGCTFDDALRLANAVGRSGDRAEFDRWVRIADYLAGGKPGALSDLGDLLGQFGTDADQPRSLAYYEAARAAGSRSAVHRLLNLYSRRTSPDYDARISAALFVDLVGYSTPEELPSSLGRLRTTTPEIKAIAYQTIDEAKLYLAAANAGNLVAMREYALILRQSATTPAEIIQSTDWLRKAAEGGDPPAMIELADALAFGIGATASRDAALDWLAKAAELGSAEADVRLRTLHLSSDQGQ